MESSAQLNVILIVIDTARADRFGCYGHVRATTPAIDDLARGATVFDRMISPASWTLPSHASLFTGLYPREHGADHPDCRMRTGITLLDSHLQRNGYRTVFVSNNPLVSKRTGVVDETSDLLQRLHFDPASRKRWLRVARALVGKSDRGACATAAVMDRMLRDLTGPFFMFINYMECHWPYVSPFSYQKRFVRRPFSPVDSILCRNRIGRRYAWDNGRLQDREELELVNDLYDASLAYVDHWIGDLLDELDRRGGGRDTVVIITADHGENIGEHGLGGHGMCLYQTLLHVPFIVRIPGNTPMRVAGLAQLTDVLAGLCGLLGIAIPGHLANRPFAADAAWLVTGRPNRAFAFAEWHYSEKADLHRRLTRSHFPPPPDLESVQDERYKLIVEPAAGKTVLFDLREDAGEQHDRASELAEHRDRLIHALEDWKTATHPMGVLTSYTPEEERTLQARLKELGYV